MLHDGAVLMPSWFNTPFDSWPIISILISLAFIAIQLPLPKTRIFCLLKRFETRHRTKHPRLQYGVKVFVSPFNGIAFRAKTFDISETGIFLPVANGTMNFLVTMAIKQNKVPKALNVNERLSVCLNLGELTQIRCEARVVRYSEPKGHYPGGWGVVFESLPRQHRKDIKKFILTKAA